MSQRIGHRQPAHRETVALAQTAECFTGHLNDTCSVGHDMPLNR